MRIIKILLISSCLFLFNSYSFAETKRDCSEYTSKTLIGVYDKWLCKQGKEPRKKLNIVDKLKKLNPLEKNWAH